VLLVIAVIGTLLLNSLAWTVRVDHGPAAWLRAAAAADPANSRDRFSEEFTGELHELTLAGCSSRQLNLYCYRVLAGALALRASLSKLPAVW
jgi:hypothetical protein